MPDLSKLTDADLDAIAAGDMSRVSDAGLEVIAGGGAAEPAKEYYGAEGGLLAGQQKNKPVPGAAQAARYGIPMLQPEGGPGGAVAAAAGEILAQAIEGRHAPGEVVAAMGMGALPFGRVAGAMQAVKNVGKAGAGAYAAEQARSLIDEGKLSERAGATAGLAAGLTGIAPVLGSVAGKITNNVSPEEAARVAEAMLNNDAKDRVLAAMQARGAAVVPSSVNPSIKNRVLESIAGIQNVEAGVARANQPLFNKIAREEASIPANKPINADTLEAARNEIGKPYREVAANAGGGDALDRWRSANTKLKIAEGKMDGGNFTVERGKAVDLAEKELADASAELDKIASSNPELADAIREAKVKFGKNYDVQKAVLSGTDEVRPSILSALLEQRGEAGLTGGLRDIAQLNNAFGRSTKNPNKLATAPGAASAGTAMIAGGGNPATTAALVGGIPMVRGALRDKLVSPAYQAANAVRDYAPGTSADPRVVELMQRLAVITALQRQNGERK